MSGEGISIKRKSLRPEHAWLLAGAALLAAVLIAGVGYVVARHHEATRVMEQLEPRFARVAGLRASGERLRTTERALSDNFARLAYGAEGDPAQAGNAALQQLRTAMTARGLQVASSQVLPAREDGNLLRIGLNMRVEGDLPALRDFQRDMAANTQTPIIFIENTQLANQPAPGRPNNIVAQLNLFVLKVRP
ncbi:type II secretion system protein GspM [Ottowia thiooxydans]|uniref:type II secretion system protein GspM n=1 Tax=Ottowia thiooxydans TaxID=219182 RepID=UPI000426957C|nr:type II secretion system protein GspM [Ottowia thiooxydans]